MRIKTDLRYELKYLIRREQHHAMVEKLAEMMPLDIHGGTHGHYPITSLYYDSPDYKAYWDKLEGHRNRRKVRVRVYGGDSVTPNTRCYLEIKQRINSMMRKRRVALSYAEAVAFDDLLETAQKSDGSHESTLREVYYLYRTLQLRPTCVVRYERMAFEGSEHYPDLRVTLDTNLHGRTHDLSLVSTGHTQDKLFLPPDYSVLEIKANHNVPYWLTQLLSRYQCTHYRISKYCVALEHSKVIMGRQRIIHASHTGGAGLRQ